LDLFDQGGNDRFAVEAWAMDFFDAFEDLADVQRLTGALQYVIDVLDVRHTFSARFLGRRARTQAANSTKLGFERDLEGMKKGGLDIGVVWHRDTPSPDRYRKRVP
jgi:hypothetical protein